MLNNGIFRHAFQLTVAKSAHHYFVTVVMHGLETNVSSSITVLIPKRFSPNYTSAQVLVRASFSLQTMSMVTTEP
ncbi:UNVERIFIED_CONTAM: hypothetical protein FKN15_078422 [Acipenser sinensis]